MSTERPTMRRLAERRHEAEQKFADLSRSVEREVGWAPRGAWLKPAVAFAVGMAMAMGRRRRRQGLEEGRGASPRKELDRPAPGADET